MTSKYFAPADIVTVFAELHRLRPEWHLALGGIMGNEQHFEDGGYHVPRVAVSPSDYSVQLPLDKSGGNPYTASALDITPVGTNSGEVMRLMTGNLDKYRNHPVVRKFVREFAGTENNTTVFAIDIPTNRQTGSQWPTSHLWHVHISFYRSLNERMTAKAIARVIAGRVTWRSRVAGKIKRTVSR